MNKWYKFLSLLIFLGLSLSFDSSSNAPASSTLTVNFNNIRNNDGQLYLFIYNYENQYPDNPYMHFAIDKSSRNSSGNMTFTIPESLAQGTYAISVIDDENKNDDLDLFFGLPTEGYAFSNDVVPFLSMPDYEELLFKVDHKKENIKITLQYFL